MGTEKPKELGFSFSSLISKINPRFIIIFSCDFTILTLDLLYAKCHLLFLQVNRDVVLTLDLT